MITKISRTSQKMPNKAKQRKNKNKQKQKQKKQEHKKKHKGCNGRENNAGPKFGSESVEICNACVRKSM